MAITWGPTLSFGNQNESRLGIDLYTMGDPNSGSVTVRADFWLWTRFSIDDDQVLNVSGTWSTSIAYRASGGQMLIGTRDWTVSTAYGSTSTRTVTGTVTGHWAGIQPSHSRSITIPARPYRAPRPPLNPTSTMQSNGTVVVGWATNYDGSNGAQPWTGVYVEQWNGASWTRVATLSRDTTSWTSGAVPYGSTYQWRIQAYSAAGVSSYATTPARSRPYSAPRPPSAVSVTHESDTRQRISITRDADSTSGAQPWTGWRVRRRVNGGEWVTVATVAGTGSSWADTSTAANNLYEYQVQSYNSAGSSAWVGSASVKTTPLAPLAPTATRSGTDVIVTFTDRSNAEDDFQITYFADGVSQGVIRTEPPKAGTGTVITYTHSPTDHVAVHSYTVTARTTSGLAATSPRSNEVKTLQPPAPPTLLTPNGVTVVGGQNVTLTWKHNPEDGTAQTAYQIRYRLRGAAEWTTLAKTTSSTSSHTLNAFTNANDYEWQVMTWGAYANGSNWSATAVFDTSARPTATITNPAVGAVIPSSLFTLTTTYTQGTGGYPKAGHRITINDLTTGEERVFEENTSALTWVSPPYLLDGHSYRVTLETRNLKGIWSAPVSRDYTVTYTTPPQTVVEGYWQPDSGSILLDLYTPDPTGTQPDVTGVRVDRALGSLVERYLETGDETLLDQMQWVTLYDDLPGNTSVYDPIPPINGYAIYRTFTTSVLGSISEWGYSIVDTAVENCDAWFWLNAGPGFSVKARWRSSPTVAPTRGRSKALRQYVGRRSPVEYRATARNHRITVSGVLEGIDFSTEEALAAVEDIGAPAVYRDVYGRREVVSIGEIAFEQLEMLPGTRRALLAFTTTLTKVDTPLGEAV